MLGTFWWLKLTLPERTVLIEGYSSDIYERQSTGLSKARARWVLTFLIIVTLFGFINWVLELKLAVRHSLKRNVSFKNGLQRPIYIINSVDYTELSRNPPSPYRHNITVSLETYPFYVTCITYVMGNCCCKFKLLENYELLSQADVGVSRGSRVNCRGLRVAGRGSRVAGRG